MTKKTMTLQEVAQCLGLEEESLERFVATGQIPFTETAEGIRFDKDAIDAFSYSLDCHSIEI
ncbi:MAG: helix-turn-helix domain-containing protein [Dehalococcoidia bacterium]|nr:MAG: helix-turn-helix domain-containing protein [Dehalococcoidia bacterium]